MRNWWALLFVVMHIAGFSGVANPQTLDQWDRAIEDLDQIIRLDPTNALAISIRGSSFAAKGQYDRAIEDFDQAVRLIPNIGATFVLRGRSYAAKGQYDRAIEDFDQAVRLIPNNFGADSDAIATALAVALYNRGLTKRAKGDSAGGDADIAKAEQLNPSVGVRPMRSP